MSKTDNDQNICLACGLCCDGTLIGFVELEDKEVTRLKSTMPIEEVAGNGFFLHPCSKFCNGCKIYEDRPKKCDEFKCGLLNAVTQKELDFNTALEAIAEVKERKATIQDKLTQLDLKLKSESFYFKTVEVKKVLQKLKSEDNALALHFELILDLEAMDSILLSKFNITLD